MGNIKEGDAVIYLCICWLPEQFMCHISSLVLLVPAATAVYGCLLLRAH